MRNPRLRAARVSLTSLSLVSPWSALQVPLALTTTIEPRELPDDSPDKEDSFNYK